MGQRSWLRGKPITTVLITTLTLLIVNNTCTAPALPPYRTLAAEAEEILARGEAAFFADMQSRDVHEMVTADSLLLKQSVAPRSNTCTKCSELLGANKKYRTPFMLSDRPELVEVCQELLREAENASTSAIEGAVRASTVRSLLNAAMPEIDLLCEGCLLHRAILVHHGHLRRLYHEEQVLSPEIADRYKLKKCPSLNMRKNYLSEVKSLEHLFPDSRNLDYHELDQVISMNPYIPLPSLLMHPKEDPHGSPRRGILIDIGPNNFYGSAKHLLDSYSPYMHFDEVHLIDIKNIKIPAYYKERYNINVCKDGVRVASRDTFDVLEKLKKLSISSEDYVVLKFDVDTMTEGQTMEWGFLVESFRRRK